MDLSQESISLHTSMEAIGYLLCNKLPTRIGATKKSLIDHIYTNTYKNEIKIMNVDRVSEVSDHNFLVISIGLNPSKSQYKQKGEKFLSNKKLSNYLEQTKFVMLEEETVEESYSNFIAYMEEGIEKSTILAKPEQHHGLMMNTCTW